MTGWGSQGFGVDPWGIGGGAGSQQQQNAPVFAGIVSATPVGNDAYLTWDAATSDSTLPANIVYEIFKAADGNINWSSPFATVTGLTTFLDTTSEDLSIMHMCYGVRAMDSNNLVDGNTVIKCVDFVLLDVTRFRKTYSTIRTQPQSEYGKNFTVNDTVRYRKTYSFFRQPTQTIKR